MSYAGSEHSFFFHNETELAISAAEHTYSEGEELTHKVKQARLKIESDNVDIEINLSTEALAKIAVVAARFLKTGETACFFEDGYHEGEFGKDQKELSVRAALNLYG